MSIHNDLIDRLVEAGSIGLDLSPGDPLAEEAAKEIKKLTEEIQKLRKALASIKCPSCQGSGKQPDPYPYDDCPCSGCKGTGIHPVASEALK